MDKNQQQCFPAQPFWAVAVTLAGLLCFSSCNHGIIDLDIQGHRGCRGLLPENTLPAFEKAWQLGATTLELDVVISHDQQVVVSHEAWFSHECCVDPSGQPIAEAQERSHIIYQMAYADVVKWDCGSKGHPRFPQQQRMKAAKPLLSEVFAVMEAKVNPDDLSLQERLPKYNIEIKVEPNGDGIFQPQAPAFVALVLSEIRAQVLTERCTIQSFDLEALRETRRQDSNIRLALLVDEHESYQDKITELGFYPEVLSPEWHSVDESMLAFAAAKNMTVIPWTVNEVADMRELIHLGVHGIITDYPDRLAALLQDM